MKITLPERLDDGIVTLRPPALHDVKPYVQAFQDDPTLGRLLGVEHDPDEEDVRARMSEQAPGEADRTFLHLSIVASQTDAFWGQMFVHSLSEPNRRAEVGFWVAPDQRRRGVLSRALALTLDWLFETVDLLRIELTTIPENAAVPGAAERLGFTHEGTLRARNIERGERVDILWFGLLREEWAERRR